MKLPTERQKKACLDGLKQQLSQLDANLRKNKAQLKKMEATQQVVLSRIFELLSDVSLDVLRFANNHGVELHEVGNLDGLNLSDLYEQREYLHQWIRLESNRERERAQSHRIYKKSLESQRKELRSQIDGLGKARIRLRRELSAKLAELEGQLTSLIEPSPDKAGEIRVLRNKLTTVDRELKNHSSLCRQVGNLQKSILDDSKLRERTKLMMVGDRFAAECLKFARDQNRRNADKVKARAERQKAEAASTRVQIRNLERFLTANSKEQLSRQLVTQRELLLRARQQVVANEQSCLRRVQQLKSQGQLSEMPALRVKSEKITWLLKQRWPHLAGLDNAVARLRNAQRDLKKTERLVQKTQERLREVAEAKAVLKQLYKEVQMSGEHKRQGEAPKIQVDTWEHAELLAVRYLRWLGFPDARRTRAGADGGVDVEGENLVAQVKYIGNGATRPMIQQLMGIASAEKKVAIFFARSYARTALDWGQSAGVALFRFNVRGEVQPANERARRLLGTK